MGANRKRNNSPPHPTHPPSPSTTSIEWSSHCPTSSMSHLDNKLQMIEEIGGGRFGSIWKGLVDGQSVTVKRFPSQHRHHYLNEKDIYLLASVESSPCLQRLLAFQEVGADGDGHEALEYQLVLSYAPSGRLQDYLRTKTIDWQSLCKMIQTTAQGLAYLHSELTRQDSHKPCIAHRDISSVNILVNEDNTCMISDFSLAIRISGSQYYSCGQTFDSQTAPVNEVGTLRYMPPEVLEGAINLRDCESAMKQIDMYALGLVLWECASRCHDLYQGIPVPHYKQPFENELGLHPTIGQMQVMIARHKARPLFPDIWKDSNPAIRLLKETIEDCWDHDADARLTALCVEVRLNELPVLWERYKSGTITSCIQSHTMANNNQKNAFRIHNGCQSFHNIIGSNSGALPLEPNDKITNELQTNVVTNRLEYPNHTFINNINNNLSNNLNDVNEDPMVSLSPSPDFEKNMICAMNVSHNQPLLTVPLQPHQGRNPCLERNLMLQSSDDNTILLEHGFKFQMNVPNNDSMVADIVTDTIANNESNDLLNRPVNDNTRNVSIRPANGVTPIPYLQNPVGINAIPKQHNVGSNHLKNINETLNMKNEASSFSKLFNWSNIKALKVWPNKKTLRQRNDNDKSITGHKYNGSTVNKENSQNIRPVSNCLISHSLPNTISLNGSTHPKVTQMDLVDGSNFINDITNDKSNHKFNVLVERPSNLDRFNSYNIATTESCDCSETNFKESSVTCDSC